MNSIITRLAAGIYVPVALVLLSGCATSDFGVKREGIENWIGEHQRTALSSDDISVRTRSVLDRLGKTEEYENAPADLLKSLHAMAWRTRNRKLVAALVELCYAQAKDSSDPDQAVMYYMSSAVYAYTYLFDSRFKHRPSPYEPDFLYAVRFYDYAATQVFRYLVSNKLLTDENFSLPFLTGKVEFKKSVNHLPYKLSHFKDFKVCYEYSPYGFQARTRQSGIGVPFVALGDLNKKKEKGKIFDIGSMAYPGTMLLRLAPNGENDFTATPTYVDPMGRSWVAMEGDNVPLEVDITTYLGFVLNKGARISPILAMMDPNLMDNATGLYLLSPYDKNKIPVVFIHGLMSYPRAWSQMINTLLANPDIRSKYQFWLFAYPTANPILYSANRLRQALYNAREQFDPKHDNPNFNRMVLVGHSMGGLLTRIMVENSGNIFPEKMLGLSSIDEIKNLSSSEKDFLKQMVVYKRLPFVNEVVFLNTPHRGSYVTRWTISELAAKLIELPHKLAGKVANINRKILVATHIKDKTAHSYVYTGVDNLDPENPSLKIFSTIPIDKNVIYHSIIGNNKCAGLAGGTDGIVPYESSHLNGAASELVIHSGHSGQKNPAAITEVERILLNHLKKK